MVSEVKYYIARYPWYIGCVFLVFNTTDGLRKPEPLRFEGDVALNWNNFVQEVEIFIAAAHANNNEKTKAYIFLNLAGKEAIKKENMIRLHARCS